MNITDQEFSYFQRFILEAAGISLSAAKKALVAGRLSKRLQQRCLKTYGEYFRVLNSGADPAEVQMAIDLLTTNETYFFREPVHFDLLRTQAKQAEHGSQPFRVWSAACSTGEEVYSIAMVLADVLAGKAFEVIGSDISSRVLESARIGHYSMARISNVPRHYLQRFCLKGRDSQEGTLRIERSLRERVRFMQINLNETLPKLGPFDMIFLRNVMIYFNTDTKRQVVSRIASQLKSGGHLIIGHSETLNDITDAVQPVAPSIYRKP